MVLRLRKLLDCLTAVVDRWQLPVVVSTHPRTRKRLEALDGITSSVPQAPVAKNETSARDMIRPVARSSLLS